MRILTVIGARPQFIKAAAFSSVLRGRGHTEFLVHTGQHYDANMSDIFFAELGIPTPDVNLNAGSGNHGEMTGAMLAGIERYCLEQKPKVLVVYGDTNSTLAGALAAAKLHIPVAHIEAGLRSFNKAMPEEINRVLTDHVSDVLLCPSPSAVANLAREGISKGVHQVGDLMYDTQLKAVSLSRKHESLVGQLGLKPGSYALATIHRPSNTDDVQTLHNLLGSLAESGMPVIFPMHPRCRARVESAGLMPLVAKSSVQIIEPVGYLHMTQLLQGAQIVLTDSGGLQKEAYWMHVPCITLREESEWVETVECGWNQVVGTDPARVQLAIQRASKPVAHPDFYGDGSAGRQICELLEHQYGGPA